MNGDAREPAPGDDVVAAHGALFLRDGARYVGTPLTRGPWDPNAMHGGAPSALLAYALARHDPGPASFVARLTVELLRPVPIGALDLAVRTIRPGGKVQWVEGVLSHDGREVARGIALRLRQEQVDVSDSVGPPVDAPPAGDDAHRLDLGAGGERPVGFWSANDVRLAVGTWMQAGPATAWFRLRCPVVDDEPVTPFERVAAAADFGSGVGNPLTFAHATGINPDVTIQVHRHPAGEWVCLESAGFAEPHGVGLAETRLHDERGPLGRALSTMLIEPVTRRPSPVPRD